MIHATSLTRVFGPTTAVRDVSFDVAPGEVFALLGPNGSGKTTTVRMLAALIAPTSGDATVVGARLSDGEAARTQIRARVGLLTESPGLYERLSASYNLLYFARLYRVAQPEQAVEKYLKLLE
ncbi:MAG: ATP-binding cassette domain-containing protein, partial [Anaerolineae bacterium]|nr:ATP-binding cassette domain-containing protein [Anaerolineae bacterium]